MDVILPVGLSLAGFALGAFVFSSVGFWLVGIHAVIKRSGLAERGALMSAILFASGPWVVLVVAILGYQVRGQSWFFWLSGSMVVALLFFGVLSFHLARKAATPARDS